MYKMRLTRDRKWFFQNFPYFQIHMDNELLKGWVSINYLTDGETRYWDFEKAGKVPVCGKDMLWLTIIPDDKSRCIGTYILPNRKVSTWYIDVIESAGQDDDGIVYYIDKYLDVILTPAGDVEVKDRNELDEAYKSGELSTEQYEAALKEGDLILQELAADIKATEKYCLDVLNKAEQMIADDRFTIFLDIDGVMDVYNPDLKIQKLIPQAIDMLKNLADRTRADVVICSDWRYGCPQFREKAARIGKENKIILWDYLETEFTKAGITINGVTPWQEDLPDRTSEINAYLNQHQNIKRFVILDDCFGDDFKSDCNLRSHLVFVDALKGLQIQNCIDACEIMNKQTF